MQAVEKLSLANSWLSDTISTIMPVSFVRSSTAIDYEAPTLKSTRTTWIRACGVVRMAASCAMLGLSGRDLKTAGCRVAGSQLLAAAGLK